VAADRAVLGAELSNDPVLSALALEERSNVAEAAGDTASALADLRASNRHDRDRHAGRYDSLMRHVQHRAALRAARQDAEARATSLAQSVADLRELVNHDHLTGLPNRRAFDADAERRARRAGVIMADIDHFKAINDARGHLIGDAVLQLVARTIAGALRDRGVAYRWGGEEFLVVVADGHAADTTAIAGELRSAIATAPWFSVAPGLTVTMSVGAAVGPADTLRVLVGHADDALYRAKAGGRDRVAIAEA
jgi:diguanylate cyclase (GGDEF)-like protein